MGVKSVWKWLIIVKVVWEGWKNKVIFWLWLVRIVKIYDFGLKSVFWDFFGYRIYNVSYINYVGGLRVRSKVKELNKDYNSGKRGI